MNIPGAFMSSSSLPYANLGRTGRAVSRVGLGGEGVLRTTQRQAEALRVIEAAAEIGITYFDCARAYADSERYHGAFWGRRPILREGVFLTSKSAARDGGAARRELEDSLRRMGTDYLDLWQIHDLRTDADLDEMTHPGGALDTFIRAREQGLVRHIGVTGHHSPRILHRAVNDWDVDTVLMPVNPMEVVLGGFLTDVLTAARAKGLGVIGMKALGGATSEGGARLVNAGFDADTLLRFALGQAIDVLIVGCASPDEVKHLGEVVHEPLTGEEESELIQAFSAFAKQDAVYRGE
jgi:aryl-alcohol dehydrogenase-like predicted oxidoreductase